MLMGRKTKACIALGMCAAAAVAGGCASWGRQAKTSISDLTGGLNRTVILYGEDGEVIREWSGKIDVETDAQKVLFDLNGKRIIINGGIVVVEEE